MIRIQVNGMRDVQRKLSVLKADVQKVVIPRAINRTVESARAQMVREITQRINIRATAVREKLSLQRATRNSPTAILAATGKQSVNLIRYDPRKVKKAPGGLSVKVRRDKGRTIVRGAFIANGGRTVFRRTGKSRLPIVALPAVGVPQLFTRKQINTAVLRSIAANLAKNVDREIRYALSKFNR